MADTKPAEPEHRFAHRLAPGLAAISQRLQQSAADVHLHGDGEYGRFLRYEGDALFAAWRLAQSLQPRDDEDEQQFLERLAWNLDLMVRDAPADDLDRGYELGVERAKADLLGKAGRP